jgi:hypothetical protein
MHVEDIGNTTRHTSGKVAASRAKHKHATTSHVLAAVVTHTLNNSGSTRVPNGKTLSSYTAEKASAARGTVQTDVTDEDVLFGLEDG